MRFLFPDAGLAAFKVAESPSYDEDIVRYVRLTTLQVIEGAAIRGHQRFCFDFAQRRLKCGLTFSEIAVQAKKSGQKPVAKC
jgi:hypothetical protein